MSSSFGALSLWGVGLLLATVHLAPAVPAVSDPVVIYQGVNVVDPARASLNRDMVILTQGERITRIAPRSTFIAPAGAKVVDLTDLYVSAGLINSHEHLATPPDRPLAEAMMRKDLYGGVTAVRDMADDLRQVADLARASRVGELAGPDIYFAALMAGPAFFEDPRTRAVTLGAVDGHTPWMQAITPQTDLRLAVAEARGTGAVAIKIYADLPGDRVAAITKEAHRQGALVWAHAAVFPASPADVIGAGVDAVSHVCMLAYQVSQAMPATYHNRPPVDEARLAPGDDPTLAARFQNMRRQGVVLDATLRVYAELARNYAAHPEGPKPYCGEPLAARLTGQAYRQGVLISTGTDGFSAATDPWPSLQDELELLQDDAGMKPADVILSATHIGAIALGRDREMGLLQTGMLANMVFTTQNPLLNVRAFRTVVLTVKRGSAFWRKDYQGMTR